MQAHAIIFTHILLKKNSRALSESDGKVFALAASRNVVRMRMMARSTWSTGRDTDVVDGDVHMIIHYNCFLLHLIYHPYSPSSHDY